MYWWRVRRNWILVTKRFKGRAVEFPRKVNYEYPASGDWQCISHKYNPLNNDQGIVRKFLTVELDFISG